MIDIHSTNDLIPASSVPNATTNTTTTTTSTSHVDALSAQVDSILNSFGEDPYMLAVKGREFAQRGLHELALKLLDASVVAALAVKSSKVLDETLGRVHNDRGTTTTNPKLASHEQMGHITFCFNGTSLNHISIIHIHTSNDSQLAFPFLKPQYKLCVLDVNECISRNSGVCSGSLGRHEDALSAFEMALIHDKNNVQYLSNIIAARQYMQHLQSVESTTPP
jgi:hypothetical protein